MAAQNLALVPFNNRANTAVSYIGWYVDSGVVVDALGGDDTITGTIAGGEGVYNDGTINTGAGNDTVRGTSAGGEGIGIDVGIVNQGKINTGADNDTIRGTGEYYGIFNNKNSTINTGADDDIIRGASASGIGIFNGGTINTGADNDTITGIITGTSVGGEGIFNNGTINTGSGNDTIRGTGDLFGIENRGTINTGTGNDTITGTSTGIDSGIYNYGTIDTGTGTDVVESLKGGFRSLLGVGETYLRADNDILKGFGTGSFYGGTGKDKLLFGKGTYEISGSTVVSGGVTMNVFEFEKIGGANSGLFNFQNGMLTVNAAGVGTFA